MIQPIFNRAALVPGLGVSRRANADVSKAILLATGKRTLPLWRMATMGYDAYIETILGLTHDALFVRDPETGELMIGDALGGDVGKCVLTPIEEWERGCVEQGHRVIVGRPFGANNAQLQLAGQWWTGNVLGKQYDRVALAQILPKAIIRDIIPYRVGRDTHFYCTEGKSHAYEHGAHVNPYWPERNPHPGTTAKCYADGRMVREANALTEYGRQFAVRI